MYKLYSFIDILKYAANKSKEKEDAILLEIQADILFLLSALCENDLHRKVCIFLPHTVKKMSKHGIFPLKGCHFFFLNAKVDVSSSSSLTRQVC